MIHIDSFELPVAHLHIESPMAQPCVDCYSIGSAAAGPRSPPASLGRWRGSCRGTAAAGRSSRVRPIRSLSPALARPRSGVRIGLARRHISTPVSLFQGKWGGGDDIIIIDLIFDSSFFFINFFVIPYPTPPPPSINFSNFSNFSE